MPDLLIITRFFFRQCNWGRGPSHAPARRTSSSTGGGPTIWLFILGAAAASCPGCRGSCATAGLHPSELDAGAIDWGRRGRGGHDHDHGTLGLPTRRPHGPAHSADAAYSTSAGEKTLDLYYSDQGIQNGGGRPASACLELRTVKQLL